MTERVPLMPSSFQKLSNNKEVLPNPRTVRATDMTWFNTSGNNIIKTDYNKCTGEITKHQYPWGNMTELNNIPFNLRPWGGEGQCNLFQRFDLYGLSSKCKCELNRCGCNDPKKNRCPLYGGSYENPN